MSNNSFYFETLEQQIAEAINIDYVDEMILRTYLVDHPSLLSLKAHRLLRDIAEKTEKAGNDNVTQRLNILLSLLDILWAIAVVAPIVVGYKFMPDKGLADLLNSLGINSTDTLYKRVDQRNDFRQEISLHVISNLSVEDWGIVALLNAIVSKSHELIHVVEEYPTLINYDTNRKMLILLEWASKENFELYSKAIIEAINYIDWARTNIDNGILVLHNAKAKKICSYYVYSDSWDEAKKIIEENQDLLLTETGLAEMASFVEGAVIYGFLAEGDWEVAARTMLKYDVLEKCKSYGCEVVFSEWRIPTIIPELWGLGAIIFAGNPSIRTLSGFMDALKNNDQNLSGRAKWIYLMLNPDFQKPSTKKELKKFHKELSDFEYTDLPTFQFYGLTYFALKNESNVIRDLIKSSQVPNTEKMISALDQLMDLSLKRNPEYLIEPIQGLKEWSRSPYKENLIDAIEKLDQLEVMKLAPNGSDLVSVVGGLIGLSRNNSRSDKINQLDNYPILTSKESRELIEKIINVFKNYEQQDLLASLTDTLNVLKEVDIYGRLASNLIGFFDKEQQLPGYINAVFIWIGTDTEEKAEKVLNDFPVLFSDEATNLIHRLINSPEITEKILAIGSKEAIDTLSFFSRKYANLLRAKRSLTEKNIHRTIPDPSFNDDANLLMELEITIPSRIWIPVSRMNLTNKLFELLSTWITDLNNSLGYPTSENLRIVQEHLKDWDTNFKRSNSESNTSLVKILVRVLSLFDPENIDGLLSITEESKELFRQNSLDILSDWIYVANDLQANLLKSKLQQIRSWIEQTYIKNMDPSVVLKEMGSDEKQRKALAIVAKSIFGFENISGYTELWNALRNLPENQYESVMQKAVETAEATGDPEQIALAKEYRLELQKMKIVNAAQSGRFEEIANMFVDNPLVVDPELIRFMYPESLQDEAIERTEILRCMASDPLLRKEMLGEELTSEEKDELDNMDAVITSVYYLDSWYWRFLVIKHNPDIFSDRGWANIHIGYKRHLETLSKVLREEKEETIIRFQQVIDFINLCRSTSFEHAMKGKLCELSNMDISSHWADDAVDLIELKIGFASVYINEVRKYKRKCC